MSLSQKTAKIIDGKKLAEEILLKLKQKVSRLERRPSLAAILVGDDPASQLYVRNKKRAAQKVVIEFHEYLCGGKFYPKITQTELLETIDWLNQDPNIDGIIIQLPLPKQFETQKIIDRLDPKKDLDGFHPKNLNKFLTDKNQLIPPLIAAIKLALQATRENLKNKKTVIIAKNPVFSQPLNQALKKQGLKSQVIKPDDKQLAVTTKPAEILISLVGKKHFIKPTMVKKDAIVIDAGINLVGKNKWVGDVDPAVAKVADWLTPVPGGIGPLTVAMLLENVYHLSQKRQ